MKNLVNGASLLNPQSPIPLYHQLADILSEKIHAGEYPADTRIPSEHQLAQAYGIGRPTARQATETLVRKGMLVRRRGAGTFVREAQTEVGLFSLGGTIAAFQKEGVAITTKLTQPVGVVSVSEEPGNPFNGTDAYHLARLSYADDMPVLIEQIYLHEGLFSGIERIELDGRSLSRAVDQHFYLRPTGGKQTFRIDYPTSDQEVQLALTPETPILAVERYLHFPNADNAVYVKLFCSTDRFVFFQSFGEGML